MEERAAKAEAPRAHERPRVAQASGTRPGTYEAFRIVSYLSQTVWAAVTKTP